MSVFRKKFFDVLEEQPVSPAVNDEAPPSEEEAIAATLEPETDPGALSIPDNPEVALRKQQTERTISTIQTWIGEVEGFIEYLNGVEPGSINHTLNSADCDSVMADVQRSESKKISRLAQDMSSLGEALKQYLLLANRKQTHSDTI